MLSFSLYNLYAFWILHYLDVLPLRKMSLLSYNMGKMIKKN